MIYFLLFYAVIYMGNAVYGTYMPVYFQSIGLTPSQIGTLLSLGPLVAVLAQPVWGAVGDRARSKNTVLAVLLLGSGTAIMLFPLSEAFIYLLLMVCLFTFFQTSTFAISDAVTLEELEKHPRWTFGTIRLGGTFGFALMSVAFGWLAKTHIGLLFPVYALVMLASLGLLTRLPRVAGYRTAGNPERIWVLLKHRKLMTYMGINLVLQITLGYYYSFFPVYFRDLGGDNALLGWSMLISSLSEIPFLLLAGKIFKKIRISWVLLVSGLATAVRWFAYSVTDSAGWLLPAQLLHGLMFIVLTVTMAIYINQEVPKSLKASGQTLYGLLSLGVARIIGSFFGGFASEAFGMRAVFAFCGWIALACCVFTVFVIMREKTGEAQADSPRAS
ncbi:MFS transporter, PPP family, 3-phenylpropionic acid transporter [Paenibacillus sp. UNCCL117]|uniref:MFS transporter n=1 Tax=unclassified Paenibacillus TaxID=185978 RepID=UPI00088025E8|nr:MULTISPECIES: MFS transporter [unclassified Paenibacillus]SDD31593.1 MFS transporter, PPP family, 3-phenylpropionic acid transporter [Paenibacillus sp. cl123]SFW40077.1 MFS transporter, PPP family, 3-phenylpropionic acid transporter [Paenibacillus sp. UNCCL117]